MNIRRVRITWKLIYIMLACLILLCTGCSAVEKTAEKLLAGEEFPTIRSMDELSSFVEEELQEGHSEITFLTESLSMQQIQTINSNLDGFYGEVSTCQSSKGLLSDALKVTLFCDISDNYYVERNILTGEAIPGEYREATETAASCRKILENMQKEIGKKADDYEKELWIHDYLVTHTSYGYAEEQEPEEGKRAAHESYGALIRHKAVCNGYAFSVKLLCDLCGVECRVITGRGNEESHAWNLVKLGDDWYHLDVTWDDPTPDEKGRIIYTYFNINDDRASLSHEWKKENYPAAVSMKDNYYIRNDLYCENYNAFQEKCIRILEKNPSDSFQVMVGDYDESIYSGTNMNFLFDYTEADSLSYQNLGEIPFMTLYIKLKNG